MKSDRQHVKMSEFFSTEKKDSVRSYFINETILS